MLCTELWLYRHRNRTVLERESCSRPSGEMAGVYWLSFYIQHTVL